jgi:hypothetical protein
MAAAARRVSPGEAAPSGRHSSPRLAEENDLNTPSPALAQQALIASLWGAPSPQEEIKWSPRRTLAFVVLTCGGFWTLVMVGAARLLG